MTGGGSPKGCPQMPNLLRVRAIFRALPLPPLLLPSPLSSTSLLSNFSPPLPFPKAVNKKLSYRGRNAFSMIKTHESNNAYANILYLYVRQSRRIMFSICPFVRSSVRFFSFVCLLPTCEREWTFVWTDFNANWHKSPPGGQGHEWSTLGSGGQSSRSQEAEVLFGSLAETSFSIPWME